MSFQGICVWLGQVGPPPASILEQGVLVGAIPGVMVPCTTHVATWSRHQMTDTGAPPRQCVCVCDIHGLVCVCAVVMPTDVSVPITLLCCGVLMFLEKDALSVLTHTWLWCSAHFLWYKASRTELRVWNNRNLKS